MTAGPIYLYVSSSSGLYAERETVGQVIAELPLTIGWRIDHTPLPGVVRRDTGVHTEGCDIYALILGSDFSAPMGAELRQALLGGRVPLAFRKECTRSPSAQDALRRAETEWHTFPTMEAFRRLFAEELLRVLLRRAVELGLELDEVERLTELARGTGGTKAEQTTVSRRVPLVGDVDRGGVILGREVWQDGPRKRA